MKQFYKEIIDNYLLFISLFLIAVIWQILQTSHSQYSRGVAEVFIGLAIVGFLKDISIKSIYFYLFLIFSILIFLFLSNTGLLFIPYTRVALEFILIIILLANLKDIFIKSIYFYIVLLFSVFIIIFQYFYGIISIPWFVLSFYFINKKIKSYTQIVNEEPINDELIDKEQTDEDII